MSKKAEHEKNTKETQNNLDAKANLFTAKKRGRKSKTTPLHKKTKIEDEIQENVIIIDKTTTSNNIQIPPTINEDKFELENEEEMELEQEQEADEEPDIILTYAEKLKSQDFPENLNTLQELSNYLSLSNESIVQSHNCGLLIKEVLIQISQYNIPDLSIQSLITINYLLDMNSSLVYKIIKYDGISLIVSLTQNVEYIDLAENAIKTIEKISNENCQYLLDSDAFCSILIFIDFFDGNTRKYVIDCCLRMTKHLRKYEILKEKIIPGLQNLTSFTKLNCQNELEKYIFEKAILCFYNILTGIKNNKLNSNCATIWEEVIQFGLLENLIEVLEVFLKSDNDMTLSHIFGKNNLVIYMDTFKNIIKIFSILCKNSEKIRNRFLDMTILNMMYNIIKEEINLDSESESNTNRSNISHHLIFYELFPFLFSFFPDVTTSTRSISNCISNTNFNNSSKLMDYFTNKIIPLLITHFVNISSISLSLKAIQLIKIYCTYINDEGLKIIKISNLAKIMSKLLFSKNILFVIEIFDLIEILCSKLQFQISFIREGVIDALHTISNLKKEDLVINKEDIRSLSEELSIKYEKINKTVENLFYSNEKKKNKLVEGIKDFLEEENCIEVFKNENKLTCEKRIFLIIKFKAEEILKKQFNEKLINESINNIDKEHNPYLILEKLKSLSKKLTTFTFDIKVIQEIIDFIIKKEVTFHELEKSEIILNLSNSFDSNFKINLSQKPNFQNLKFEKNVVQRLQQFLKIVDYEKIKFLILLFQNCLSFMNCFKICINDFSSFKNSAHLFQSSYRSSIQKYKINLIYIINEDVLNENGIDLNYQELHSFYSKEKCKSLEVNLNENFQNLQEIILKRKFDNNLEEISHFERDLIFTMGNRKGSEDLQNTERILAQLLERKQSKDESDKNVSNTYLPDLSKIVKKNKYQIVFYCEISNKIIYIQKNWNLKYFLKEVKNLLSKNEASDFLNEDIPIKFEIIVKDEILEIGEKRKSSANNTIQPAINKQDSCSEIIMNNLNENFIEELIFTKFYNQRIITNTALYSIPNASYYLYLIGVFELCINNFPNLFKFKENLKANILKNSKVSTILTKQLRDPYAISSNNVPNWCKDIAFSFPYLTDFTSRYLYFKTSSFDMKRSMTNLYLYVKNVIGEVITEENTLTNGRRRKFTIDREELTKSTDKLILEYSNYTGYLEFEFFNETGSGLGPTNEYFSIYMKEFSSKTKLFYKTTDYSLFPLPFLTRVIGPDELDKIFFQLGFVLARALYDDRLIYLPFNSLFWDIILDRPLTYKDIPKIDVDLGKVLSDLLSLVEKKTQLIADGNYKGLSNILLYNKMRLEDLGISFVIPGYENLELKENASEQTLSAYNLEEYLNLILDAFFYGGQTQTKNAFIRGFNSVFPITSLSCFTSEEISEYLCGSEENWDYTILYQSIVPNHGYDKSSNVFKWLIDALISMNKQEKKMFLLFVTGCPRLPIGGIKNLNPKITVVKRTIENSSHCPDSYLPTVMTCQNYIKIPDYSSVDIFKFRLNMAINEGTNSFDLS